MTPFSTTFAEFLNTDQATFVGYLVGLIVKIGFSTLHTKQTDTWEREYDILKEQIANLLLLIPEARNWQIICEYPIPRRSKRPDVIVLANDLIFVVEFKVGADNFDAAARWQVLDYCLDLRDFHEQSSGRLIIPVLIATEAQACSHPTPSVLKEDVDQAVMSVKQIIPSELAPTLAQLYRQHHSTDLKPLQAEQWLNSSYRPVMSMIEAAESLFASHDIREIAHAASGNLTDTTQCLVEAIQTAQIEKQRIICFVTGVPGAGKTLTGLNAVHDPVLRQNERPVGVFLSGNVPLVRIVQEALVRDAVKRSERSAAIVKREVTTFIQNVHRFLEEYGTGSHIAPEHVVVFDEAQRAWDAQQLYKKRKIAKSEATLLFDIMERCPDWCVIIALIGGGQEIHDGEGGLQEWASALAARSLEWRVIVSPELYSQQNPTQARNHFDRSLFASRHNIEIEEESRVHLKVSMRNLRSQAVSDWVNAVIDCDEERANFISQRISNSPMSITRNFELAKNWIKQRCVAGDRRYGLLASSGALRSRAYGLELSGEFRSAYKYEEWFLSDPSDFRSSFQLEVAATEFECQGLELDWTCICWGDDLTFDASSNSWRMLRLNGRSWQNVKKPVKRSNLLNKYRVLLTRAREGQILWIPPGSESDFSRPTLPMQETADFLIRCGAVLLESQADAVT